jgi:biopolymer transport protein ExbB/biopolymer transport protein TolQ
MLSLLLLNHSPSGDGVFSLDYYAWGFLIGLDSFGVMIAVTLALMSMYSIAVIVERTLFYIDAARHSRKAEREINDALRFNNTALAIALSERYSKSPTASIFQAVMIELHPLVEINPSVIEQARITLDRAIDKQTSSLKKGLEELKFIAWLAPPVALFGVLIGGLDLREIIMGCYGPNIDALFAWIYHALWWMIFGLVVAALSALASFYFRSKVEKFVAEMKDYSATFLGWMLRHQTQLPAMQRRVASQSRVTSPVGFSRADAQPNAIALWRRSVCDARRCPPSQRF